MKQYRREVSDYKRDKPKLYALILKYLSDESTPAKGLRFDTCNETRASVLSDIKSIGIDIIKSRNDNDCSPLT